MDVDRKTEASSDNTVIVEMLKVATRRKVQLSTSMLARIVTMYSGIVLPREDEEWPFDWNLIAEVMGLDSDVFLSGKNSDKGEPLLPSDAVFDALSTVSLSQRSDEVHIKSYTALQEMLTNSVAVPLMNAYTRSRDLPTFIDKWFQQLADMVHLDKKSRCIWTDGELSFALRSVLDGSLMSPQILEMIKRMQKPVDALLSAVHNDPNSVANLWTDSRPPLNAGLVVLDAILGALKQDSTVDTLEPCLEELEKSLFALFHQKTLGKVLTETHVWTVMSRLWALLWPGRQARMSKEEVLDLGRQRLGSKAFERARRYMHKQSRSMEESEFPRDASACIAAVCDSLRGIELLQRDVSGNVRNNLAMTKMKQSSPSVHEDVAMDDPQGTGNHIVRFTGHCTAQSAEVMIQFPKLLALIPSAPRRFLFSRILQDTLKVVTQEASTSTQWETALLPKALLRAIIESNDTRVVDDISAAMCQLLESTAHSPDDSAEKLATHLYFQTPVAAIPRAHRESILNHTTRLIRATRGRLDTKDNMRRLSLMVKLMEMPNATAEVSKNPNLLWELASPIEGDAASISIPVLGLVEELVKLTIGHLLATKEQARSQDYLQELTLQTVHFASKTSSYAPLPGSLVVAKAVFSALHNAAAPDIGGWQLHASAEVEKKYLQTLFNDIEKLLQTLSGQCAAETGDTVSLQCCLQAVADLPASLLARDEERIAYERIQELMCNSYRLPFRGNDASYDVDETANPLQNSSAI
ncbi:hypothetical protein LTR66_005630 [Elasticomyces elasticus]|nr:hypothetical protein LTR66_005630 [Elasticomyces elasticus]